MADYETPTGNGGELHQSASGATTALTTNHGVPVSDNENSLKSGTRGPTLLEDFVLREKIFHFDHERIPERIVHARGSGAHGMFVAIDDISELGKAAVFTKGERTEVFARLSTVGGGAGSVDMPRDVRGFAVKFYTREGNWDLVGNNIPVFFIQDAIKFPDVIHAVKMEADRAYARERGFVLRRDGGGEWRLDLGWRATASARRLIVRRVRAVGVRDGFDLLAVDRLEALDGG